MPFANNNGVKIHYEVEGSGPPILLQHGFSGTLDAWHTNGMVQELSKNYRCIFLSARGRGQSDKPHDPKAYYFKNLVSDLVAVLDDQKVKKAHYLGYSMGGAIGFRIPMYAPDRFYSLMLGGASFAGGAQTQAYDDLGPAYDAMERAVKEGKENPMAVFLPIYEKNLGAMPPDRRTATLAQDAKALAAAWQARKEETSPDSKDYLPKVVLPCLIYAGEADPRCSDAKATAQQIKNAQFFSLPGLNHSQANAHSELTLPHIKKFLAEVSKTIK
jgi:pimeloyl-ACP methyl ester carboxylesterase